MKLLRAFCFLLLSIAGLVAVQHFKNDSVPYYGVVVAEEVKEESNVEFNNETPNFPKKTAVKKGSITVNINTAGIDELISLPGIGEVTAQKIIDYRKQNGVFTVTADLKKIKGIGDKKFDAVKDLVVL